MFTHPEEIAVAFASLRDRGLVSMFGVSNYTPSQTMALSAYVEEPLVSTQPEFSCATLAPLRDGTLDLCMEEGITPLAWSPLAGGRLATGHGLRPDLLSVLDELAEREGVSRAAIAIAFVLAHPADAVALVGTQTPERLTELVASTRVQLSRTDVYRIVVASDGVPLP
jgi:predicted oxidoreductase